MRRSVGGNDPERSWILVENRDVVCALQNLELIRHTPRLRRNERHAVRRRTRVIRAAHNPKLFCACFQDRAGRPAATRTTAWPGADTGIHAGEIGLAVCRLRNVLLRIGSARRARRGSGNIDGHRLREQLIIGPANRERVRRRRAGSHPTAAARHHASRFGIDRHRCGIFRMPYQRERLSRLDRCRLSRKADDAGRNVPGLAVCGTFKTRGHGARRGFRLSLQGDGGEQRDQRKNQK